MQNLIFMSLVFVFAISSFAQAHSLSTFNAAYLGLYKGLAENSVIFVDEKGVDLDKPMFYSVLFDHNVSSYLEAELGQRLLYQYKATVYDEATGKAALYGTKAVITIKVRITDWKNIAKAAVFVIQEGI